MQIQIHISEDIVNENDITIIKLLEVSLLFEKEVEKIRNKFNINEGSFHLYSENLNKYKKPIKEAFKSIKDDYKEKLKDKKLQEEVTSLCQKFNLDERWYSAIAEIVLFSSVTNLNDEIYCWVSKNYDKHILISSPSIMISIPSDTSKEKIIQWIRNNWGKYRQEAQLNSVLKKQKGIPLFDFIEFDQEIIKMHERQNMNPHQISLVMEKKYENSKSKWEQKVNEKMIEQRLKRYKKLFNLK